MEPSPPPLSSANWPRRARRTRRDTRRRWAISQALPACSASRHSGSPGNAALASAAQHSARWARSPRRRRCPHPSGLTAGVSAARGQAMSAPSTQGPASPSGRLLRRARETTPIPFWEWGTRATYPISRSLMLENQRRVQDQLATIEGLRGGPVLPPSSGQLPQPTDPADPSQPVPLGTPNTSNPTAPGAAPTQTAGTAPVATPEEPKEPEKSLEELFAELDDLIGLDSVKREIHQQVALLKVEKRRAEARLKSATITRHLVFVGNPGTGAGADDRRPDGRRHLSRSRPALQGPPCRYQPQRTRRRLSRANRHHNQRGRRESPRRRALHRRGLWPQWRPIQPRSGQHLGEGNGG